MENDGIQPLVLRITMRPSNFRRAQICSGSRKSSSSPASDRRLMNPETMKRGQHDGQDQEQQIVGGGEGAQRHQQRKPW